MIFALFSPREISNSQLKVNLADIMLFLLKEYSTQLTKAEIDTTVHTLSNDGVDKLIELYMEKLQKGEV